MAGEIGIHVDISEVDAYLSAIGDPKRVKAITRKALRKGARITQAAIAERAPERPDLPYGGKLPIGALKNDIIVRTFTDNDGKEVASVQAGDLTDHVAGWVEFGHRMVVGPSGISQKGYTSKVLPNGKLRGSGTESGSVPAHPFFRPGAEASEEAAAAAIVDSLAEDAVNENAPTVIADDSEAA